MEKVAYQSGVFGNQDYETGYRCEADGSPRRGYIWVSYWDWWGHWVIGDERRGYSVALGLFWEWWVLVDGLKKSAFLWCILTESRVRNWKMCFYDAAELWGYLGYIGITMGLFGGHNGCLNRLPRVLFQDRTWKSTSSIVTYQIRNAQTLYPTLYSSPSQVIQRHSSLDVSDGDHNDPHIAWSWFSIPLDHGCPRSSGAPRGKHVSCVLYKPGVGVYVGIAWWRFERDEHHVDQAAELDWAERSARSHLPMYSTDDMATLRDLPCSGFACGFVGVAVGCLVWIMNAGHSRSQYPASRLL